MTPAHASEWELEIHHIDLGEGRPAPGDATLLLARKNGELRRTCLIDGGTSETSGRLLRYLERCIPRGQVDVLVNTHYDDEHMGGLVDLLGVAAAGSTGTVPAGHRLFRKTRVIDIGFNKRYRDRAPGDGYLRYLRSVYGVRDGGAKLDLNLNLNALSIDRNVLLGEGSGGPSVALLRYIKDDDIRVEAGGQEEKLTKVADPGKHFMLAVEREHVTRFVSDTTPAASTKKPDWLLHQELLWTQGTARDDKLRGGPEGGIRLVCIAANRSYATDPGGGVATAKEPLGDDLDLYMDHFSLALVLEFNNFRYYIGGDLPGAIEEKLGWIPEAATWEQRLSAMKTSHHGESASTPKEAIKRWKPIVAFVSCGLDSALSRPHKGVMDLLKKTSFGIGIADTMKTRAWYLTGFFLTTPKNAPPKADQQFIPALEKDKEKDPGKEFAAYAGMTVAGLSRRYLKGGLRTTWPDEPDTLEGPIARPLPGHVVLGVTESESRRGAPAGAGAPRSLFRVHYLGFERTRSVLGESEDFEPRGRYRTITDIFLEAEL